MELTTRSTSLAFAVSGIYICACARIPHALEPQGIQVVLFVSVFLEHLSLKHRDSAQRLFLLPCPSLFLPMFYQCDGCPLSPFLMEALAGLSGLPVMGVVFICM